MALLVCRDRPNATLRGGRHPRGIVMASEKSDEFYSRVGGDRIASRQIDELIGIARGLVADIALDRHLGPWMRRVEPVKIYRAERRKRLPGLLSPIERIAGQAEQMQVMILQGVIRQHALPPSLRRRGEVRRRWRVAFGVHSNLENLDSTGAAAFNVTGPGRSRGFGCREFRCPATGGLCSELSCEDLRPIFGECRDDPRQG